MVFSIDCKEGVNDAIQQGAEAVVRKHHLHPKGIA